MATAFAILGALVGCSSTPAGTQEVVPPAVCREVGTPAAPAFADITAEVGWPATDPNSPVGTLLQSADLDGDGYPDLITSGPLQDRRQMFMNRPDPTDASRRVFQDVTETAGLTMMRDGVANRRWGSTLLGDVDNDGDVDAVVFMRTDDDKPGFGPNDVFLNDGSGNFTLAPSSEFNAEPIWASSASFFDYNRDGVLDIIVGAPGQWPGQIPQTYHLYRGNGDGTFTDVAYDVGLADEAPNMLSTTVCDLDDDGDDDILMGVYGRAPNQVWLNAGGTFTEHGVELGLAYDDGLDYSDNDSYRCYCEANAGACSPAPPPSSGQCPGRGWRPGVDDKPPRLGGNTFGIACGDVDNDGDRDVMTADLRHGDVGSSSDESELVLNGLVPGGQLTKFTRPGPAATGISRTVKGIYWNQGDMGPVFVDVDNDGRKDVYLTSSDYPGTHNWMWQQQADGKFVDVTDSTGTGQRSGQGVAFVDLERDGDLDLIAGTSTFRSSAPTANIHVYRNEGGHQANWTQIRLVGLGGAGHANRSGIGARVRVTAGGVTQTQELQVGYANTIIENDLVLTFGLGAACEIDQIEVRWPDAASTVTVYSRPRANYRLELREGDPKVHYLLTDAQKAALGTGKK